MWNENAENFKKTIVNLTNKYATIICNSSVFETTLESMLNIILKEIKAFRINHNRSQQL